MIFGKGSPIVRRTEIFEILEKSPRYAHAAHQNHIHQHPGTTPFEGDLRTDVRLSDAVVGEIVAFADYPSEQGPAVQGDSCLLIFIAGQTGYRSTNLHHSTEVLFVGSGFIGLELTV